MLRVIPVLPVLLLVACASPTHGPRTRPLTTADALDTLECTPLLLTVSARSTSNARVVGAGSGVLVGPRLIATASHVVPPGASLVTAFVDTGTRGEAVAIDHVIRGEESHFWDGDWAIIVLKTPFLSLQARAAPRLAEPDSPVPTPGTEVLVAGFPFAQAVGDPLERRPVLLASRVIARPSGVPESPSIFFARNTDGDPGRPGASGSPVFVQAGAESLVLVGLYCGTADRALLGIQLERSLVIHRLPTAAIRSALEALD